MASHSHQQLALLSSTASSELGQWVEGCGAASDFSYSYGGLGEASAAQAAGPNFPSKEKVQKRKASKRKQQAFKVKMCRYFAARRGCRKGDACEFAHGEEEVSPKPQPQGVGLLGKNPSLGSVRSETTCCSPSSPPSHASFGFSADEDYEVDGMAQWTDELVSRWAGGPSPAASGKTPPLPYALNLAAVVARLRTKNTFLEFEDNEEDGKAQRPSGPSPAAIGKTPPLAYSLNFAGVVARLRTKNTFIEFEDEEPPQSAAAALRRRGSSAPPPALLRAAAAPSAAGKVAA